jgi:hypothetical protein
MTFLTILAWVFLVGAAVVISVRIYGVMQTRTQRELDAYTAQNHIGVPLLVCVVCGAFIIAKALT